MARTTITKKTVTPSGYNLTDVAPTTMSTGAGNGVSFAYEGGLTAVLVNDSGGAAAYTVLIPETSQYSDMGITFTDDVITVANNKTWLYPVPAIAKQSDGNVYIDCDVAGKIFVLDT